MHGCNGFLAAKGLAAITLEWLPEAVPRSVTAAGSCKLRWAAHYVQEAANERFQMQPDRLPWLGLNMAACWLQENSLAGASLSSQASCTWLGLSIAAYWLLEGSLSRLQPAAS